MRYLLDTNACIAVMRKHPAVVQRLSAQQPKDCAVSTVTSFALYTGVEKCVAPATERAKVDLLLATVRVLPFDSTAAQEAARIRAVLESQGNPIGPYDVLLAGVAVANGLKMVSANVGEFQRVPGLSVENWQT